MKFKKLFIFIMVLVIASFVATGIFSSVRPSEAKFVVTYVDMPDEVEVGETVTVTASVRNTGGKEGTYTVTLTLNGEEVDSQDVTLRREEPKTVTFLAFHVNVAGSYEVAVDGMSRTLEVTAAEEPTPEATPSE
jgi:subtilase family serine protease